MTYRKGNISVETTGDTQPGEISGRKWKETIFGESDRPPTAMGLQSAAFNLFVKVFPRPVYADPERGRVAAACADISALLILILVVYVLQNTLGIPVSKPGAVYAILFFIGYMVAARWVVARGWLEVAVVMIGMGIAIFWTTLTLLAGTIKHTQITILVLGVVYITFLLGRERGFVGLVGLIGLVMVSAAPEYARAEAGEPELEVLKQIFTAITVMIVMYAVAALLREHMVEKTNIALHERDDARRKLEDSNRQLAQLLAETTNRLEHTVVETNKVLFNQQQYTNLNQMVAGLAHELGTPIGNSVLAASNIAEWSRKLRETGTDNPSMTLKLVDLMAQSGEIIGRNLHRANTLVATFKQVGLDRVAGTPRKGDLSASIERVLVEMKPMLEKYDVEVQTDLTPGIQLETYFFALEQAITNLVANAIIHGIDGQPGGWVSIQTKLTDSGTQACIDVINTGHTIPRAIRDKIFNPFFTTKQGQGGTGLGLSIVQHIVTILLDGHIRLAANPSGTRFSVTIPLKASNKSKPTDLPGETSPAPIQ